MRHMEQLRPTLIVIIETDVDALRILVTIY